MRSFQFILKFFFFVDELGGDITCSSWLRKAVAQERWPTRRFLALFCCGTFCPNHFSACKFSPTGRGNICSPAAVLAAFKGCVTPMSSHVLSFFVPPNGNRTTGFMSDLILRHPHHAFISYLQNRHLVDFIWRKRLLVSPYQRSLLAFSHGPEKEKLA